MMAQAVEEREHQLSALYEKLQRIINTINASIILTEEGQVSMLNPSAHKMWDLDVGQLLSTALMELPTGFHEEYAIHERYYDIHCTPIEGFGLLWLIEDVTQRLNDRERLARTRRLAIVGRMLAQITHEVRNPLNAMSLNVEMLSDEDQSEEAREMLSIILSEVQRLEKITERYLSLSRVRAAELVESNPFQLIKEIISLEQLVYAHISFEVTGEGSFFMFDEEALRGALRNIIRNAAEANADRITFVLRYDQRLDISIEDNGEGMESTEQIFDPFFTTKAQGTGLGLVISQQELAESGCTLRCTSQKGVGTTFFISVPYVTKT